VALLVSLTVLANTSTCIAYELNCNNLKTYNNVMSHYQQEITLYKSNLLQLKKEIGIAQRLKRANDFEIQRHEKRQLKNIAISSNPVKYGKGIIIPPEQSVEDSLKSHNKMQIQKLNQYNKALKNQIAQKQQQINFIEKNIENKTWQIAELQQEINYYHTRCVKQAEISLF